MQAKRSERMIANGFDDATIVAASIHAIAPRDALPPGFDIEDALRTHRQDYLDALPIAAALVAEVGGDPTVLAANRLFDQLDRQSENSPPENDEEPRPLIRRRLLDDALRRFLASDDAMHQFDWRDGGGVGGRHFVVRLARLAPLGQHACRCIVSLIDRTAEVETERSLRAEMLHDSLTGLPNRVAFNEAVENAIGVADGARASFAVLVVDLARFSRINESMGSIAGDELIITVARRMVSALRAGDTLARIGGDEFGVLLRLADGPGDALHAARRIQASLSTPFRLCELEIRVDCAIGCAMMSDRISVSEDIVRNAQFALKRGKVSGRVEVYHPGEVIAARRRFSLETELRRAIENDQLTLAFQPLIDLKTGHASGFEALARWTHGEHGVIPPNDFIPVAEESGLIVPLGRWAVDASARAMLDWDHAAGRNLGTAVNVNVSAIQLARDDVAMIVQQTLDRTGLTGDRFGLEITESAIIRDPERATRVLKALKALDVKVAMDDFGTGYSSLAYLQRLPIDVLKIDRSFVTGMLGDRDSVAIVRAVLGLATALGMETTAEGVETVELAQTLAALGCSYGQGFHFAMPLGADAAYEFWMARNA